MKVTNNSLSPLVFADGRLLRAGETKNLPDVDQEHSVHKAWLAAGMIEFAEAGDVDPDVGDKTGKKTSTKK